LGLRLPTWELLLGAPTPRLERPLALCLPPRAFPRRTRLRGLLLGDAVITGWRCPGSSTDAGPGPGRGVGSASTGACVSEDSGACPAPLRRCMITATAMVHTTPTAPLVPMTAIHLCNHHIRSGIRKWGGSHRGRWGRGAGGGRDNETQSCVSLQHANGRPHEGRTSCHSALSEQNTSYTRELHVVPTVPAPSLNQYTPRLATAIDGAILCA
jgi:hypothetical protein